MMGSFADYDKKQTAKLNSLKKCQNSLIQKINSLPINEANNFSKKEDPCELGLDPSAKPLENIRFIEKLSPIRQQIVRLKTLIETTQSKRELKQEIFGCIKTPKEPAMPKGQKAATEPKLKSTEEPQNRNPHIFVSSICSIQNLVKSNKKPEQSTKLMKATEKETHSSKATPSSRLQYSKPRIKKGLATSQNFFTSATKTFGKLPSLSSTLKINSDQNFPSLRFIKPGSKRQGLDLSEESGYSFRQTTIDKFRPPSIHQLSFVEQ
jgi:hypothetical protein